VDAVIASGAVESLWSGVFLVRGAPLTYDARLWAGAVSTGGVLGFATAAHLWGVVEDQPQAVNVIIPRSLHLWRQPGLRLHRTQLRPTAITRRHGLPVTTRRETVLDYIGRLHRVAATTVADRAIQLGWLTPTDFERRVRQQPGRTGNTRLRELAELVSDGAAATSERVLHKILRRAAVSGWVPNYDVWHEGCLVAVVDVALPKQKVAIEVDGMAHHTSPDRFQRDRTRQNDLVGLGWTVLRFTWSDLIDRPSYVIAVIRGQLADAA